MSNITSTHGGRVKLAVGAEAIGEMLAGTQQASANGRYDSNESAYLDRQLTHMREQVFEEAKPYLSFRDFIRIKSDIPMHVGKYEFKTSKSGGKADFLGHDANDFPVVNQSLEDDDSKYLLFGCAVILNLLDIQAAMATGSNLQRLYFTEARRVMEEFANTTCWVGRPEQGLHGFVDNPNLLAATAENDLSSDTSGANMVATLRKGANEMVNATEQVERPDTLILPPQRHQSISEADYSGNFNSSAKGRFLANNNYISNVEEARELWNASRPNGSSSNFSIYLRKGTEYMEMPYSGINQLEIYRRGPMTFMVPFIAKVGGLAVYRRGAALVMDGV